MDAVLKLNRWANAHTNIGIDALRFLLGAFLFYKGLFLLGSTTGETHKILQSMPGLGGNLILVHYIVMAHICGGIFITVGMITRISALVQLPIVLAAVIVNCMGAIYVFDLVQALLCFAACVFFSFYGSGRHSVDYNLQLHF